MGGFYGAVITAKKATPYVPRALEPGEPPEILHVSGCSIPADCKLKDRTRVSLMLKQGDDPAICVCTLSVGSTDSMLMSLVLESYSELSLIGPPGAVVHVHGAFTAEGAGGEEEDEEADSDDENLTAAQMMEKHLQTLIGQPSGLREGEGGEGSGSEDDDDSDEDASEGEDEGAELATGEKIVTRYTGSKHVEITDLESGEKLKAQTVTMTEEATNGDAAMGGDGESSGDDESDDDDEEDEEEEVAAAAAQAIKRGSRAATAAAAKQGAGEKGESEDDEEGSSEDEDEESSGEDDDEDEEAEAPPSAAPNGKRKPDDGVEPSAKRAKRTKFANGFEVSELQQASNPKADIAKPGSRVAVRYTGTLQSNGKVFDQTKGKKTFSFRLGVGDVIKGWDKGVAGMRVGDKRRLVVPPSMAYGETGVKGVIPRNATLCFDVELCRVQKTGQ